MERARRRLKLAEASRAARIEQKLRSPQAKQHLEEIGNTVFVVSLGLLSVAAPAVGRVAQGLVRVIRYTKDWLRARSSR